jgi:DNA-binding NarL/FixJ family response regulator
LPYTVLLVDDSAVVRRSLRSCFEKSQDWQVCGEAVDGREAIEKTHELSPDLVILDLSMPHMNGLEAARELKRIRPQVLLLMFTTFNTPRLEEEAIAAGCAAVISKDNVQLLFNAMGRLLSPRS